MRSARALCVRHRLGRLGGDRRLNILQATLAGDAPGSPALPLLPDPLQSTATSRRGCGARSAADCRGHHRRAMPRIDAISAASILAKTSRDALMEHMHALYPGFCFSRSQGLRNAGASGGRCKPWSAHAAAPPLLRAGASWRFADYGGAMTPSSCICGCTPSTRSSTVSCASSRAGRCGGRRGDARGGAHRPEQPLRHGQVLPGGTGARHQAHRRRRSAWSARRASARRPRA